MLPVFSPTIADTDQFFFQPEMLRLRGEAFHAEGSSDCAQRSLRSAMDLARKQGAGSFELRAAVNLGEVLCRDGRPQDVSRALQRLYDWFTEGLDTPDLLRARRLLERVKENGNGVES